MLPLAVLLLNDNIFNKKLKVNKMTKMVFFIARLIWIFCKNLKISRSKITYFTNIIVNF